MGAFRCGHCGRRFGSPEELEQHEKECGRAAIQILRSVRDVMGYYISATDADLGHVGCRAGA